MRKPKLKFREDGSIVIRVNQKSSSADELIVIGGGPRYAYVWVGKNHECLAHFGGERALTKLRDALTIVLKKGRRRGDR